MYDQSGVKEFNWSYDDAFIEGASPQFILGAKVRHYDERCFGRELSGREPLRHDVLLYDKPRTGSSLPTPSDVFIDVGSGKGRVLCCAAHRRVKKVVGIEISKELCAIAEANAAQMRHRLSPVEVKHGCAQEFSFHEGNALFFFNPFGPATVEAVLDQIERSRNGQPLRIAYVNPLYDAILAERTWLRPTTRWDAKSLSIEHSVSFYISSP